MKKERKFIALLLTLIIIIGITPISVMANTETIEVTLKFDASVVCENSQALYHDLISSGMIDASYTPIPNDITLNVSKGTTVKEIIQKAQEENNFAISGLNENYITNVGFIGNDVLSNLVAISIGDYFSSNVFSSAGWLVLIDDELASSGIDTSFVDKNSTITLKYNLCTVWGETPTFYDDLFLEKYNSLKELISTDVDTKDFSDTQKENLSKAKNEAEELILSIENEAKLNEEISSVLKEAYPEFNTDDGMWLGYYEKKGISLWGTGSITEELIKKEEELKACIDPVCVPTYSNELSKLFIGTLMSTEDENLISFNKDVFEYEIYNYYDNLLNTFIKVNFVPCTDNATVEVLLNDTTSELADLGNNFKKISNLDWENNDLYTLTFKVLPDSESELKTTEYKVKIYKGEKPQSEATLKELEEDKKERIIAVINNIAGTYIDKTTTWEVYGIGEYSFLYPEASTKLSENSKQAFIDASINEIKKKESETNVSLPILALAKSGKSSKELYDKNNNLTDGIEVLNSFEHSSSPWSAPYTLAVYRREEYFNKEKAEALLTKLIEAQTEEGCWDYFGTIDTTANAILGLSLYMDYDDEALKEKINSSIDKAIAYLSQNQNNDGTYSDSMSGKNSNSTSMVAMALCSCGIDLINDQRFIKDNNTIIDGLLSFVTADNKGIGFLDNSEQSAYSNEQGLRAFISILNVLNNKAPYNTYDIRNIDLEAAYETKEEGGGGSTTPITPQEETIKVSVTIKTHTSDYWLTNYNVTISKNEPTVALAFIKACEENNITQSGASSGYVSKITFNNVTLKSAGIGANSGWMYMVNGVTPTVGILDYRLKNNDKIVWYYTADYTTHSGSWSDKKEEEKEEIKKEDEEKEIANKSYSDISGHWAEKAIEKMSNLGYMKGVDDSRFSPDEKLTRGMFVTILYRMANEPKSEKTYFSDIKEADYYFNAVNWAYGNNIVSGINAKEFAPSKEISREEMAVIFYRYHKYLSLDTESKNNLSIYNDKITISSWATEALIWANGVGLITGKGDKLLYPKDTATRAEVSEVFIRYIEKYMEEK